MIILRNILVGCQLSKRLRELERAGIIEVRPKPDGHGLTYEPTQAGRELSELKPEHAHPGVVLWVWANFFLDRDRLPPGRVVVRFEYPTLAGSARRGWLLTERGDAEYCLKHPGAEEQLIVVVNDPLAFARWHMGQIQWRDALRSGAIEVQGPPALARALRPGTGTAGRPRTRAPATTDRPSTGPPNAGRHPHLSHVRAGHHHARLRFRRRTSPLSPSASPSRLGHEEVPIGEDRRCNPRDAGGELSPAS